MSTDQKVSERLAAMTEAELRQRWHRMDFGLWEFESETDPDRSGNNFLRNPADEYMYDDMSREADLINRELERRGLPPCERREDEGETGDEVEDFWLDAEDGDE